MSYIKVIQPEEAEGRLKEIYENLKKSRGKIAEVHKIHSINPDILVRHMDLYIASMFGKSPLTRPLREMIAVVVSKVNNCDYCITHHLEALKHFWKNDLKINKFLNSYNDVGLSRVETIICNLAVELTNNPNSNKIETFISELIEEEVEDRVIHDAVTIISYFNFVNRIVLGLGVNIEYEPGGYKY